ncbi:MAG: hypothetical protein ABI874_05135, partial [Chloroflexota bacterium]
EFAITYDYSGMRVHNTTNTNDPQVEEKARKFLGFHTVRETMRVGNANSAAIGWTETDFYQYARDAGLSYAYNIIDPRRGKSSESRTYDAASNLLRKTTNGYDWLHLFRNDGRQLIYQVNFVRLNQVDQLTYEGTSTPLQTRTTYAYDGYGNVSDEYHWGNLSNGNDAVNNQSVHRWFNVNANNWIVNKLGWEKIYATIVGDVGGVNLKTQAWYTYDNTGGWWNALPDISKGDVVQMDRGNQNTFWVTTWQTYDIYGNVLTATDPRGNRTSTQYDPVYHVLPTLVTNALGQQIATTYDLTLQKPLTITDPNNARTRIAYDAFGRRVQVWSPTEPDNASPTGRLTLSDPPTIIEAENGYSGHQCGSLQSGAWQSPNVGGSCAGYLTFGPYWTPTVAGPGQTALFRLAIDSASGNNDPIARIEVEDAGAGYQIFAQRTVYRNEFQGGLSNFQSFALTFDTTGRAGHALEYRVLWYGNAILAHDKTSVAWTQSLFTVKTEVRTDLGGNNTAVYQPKLDVYNGLGQTMQSQAPDDTSGYVIVTNQRYNALGKVERASLPHSIAATFGAFQSGDWNALDSQASSTTTYDAFARPLVLTNPDDTQTRHAYGMDTDWNLGYTPTGLLWHRVTDANNHIQDDVQDALGRLVKVREFNGNCYLSVINPCNGAIPYQVYAQTNYAYDVLGNLTSVTDAANNVTTLTYDALSRKRTMTDPDMGYWQYNYDSASNLISQTDAKGQTITFVYDALNRLTNKNYPANSGMTNIAYGYDAGVNGKGNRTSMTDGSGSASWTYDARGRVTSESKTINGAGTFVTTMSYDAADRMRTLTYPDGEIVTSGYSNARGLFNSLATSLGGNYINSTSYNALGLPMAQTAGNSVTTNDGYNPSNYRLTQIQVGGTLLNMQYAYDNVGNVSRITDVSNSN